MGILIVRDFQIIEGDAEAEGLRATDGSSSSGDSPLPSDQSLFSKASDSDKTDSDATRCDSSEVTECTITFKCIGATKSGLSKARKELSLKQAVSVRLMPEPNNPIDKSAIAFQCYMNGNWMRIGYI